ncbi:50S ribosomal protein L16 [Candidatus Carsonella ruddii]|uniref:50S ribosomal protein L16 n=2 Tax=cellular organisms TaxID=131567 RepID=A0AAJ6JW60_CARRU|nr:50S ribosomal protein L16 [Candidatus Carsonella ruddii]WGS66638.1 50S ribosomal protein L16 [Candidatus Carsonella ruddii]WGS66835.1 50S ribosomal protein L16 [Candidatus Carsonella ruddii]WGS67027.1 50S ribosomal protein L16 [Candidatus Carsonella ruddii]WGS67218.1 50S ribosomal protein L16 [Candidatus Carsonella ruddii]WMC18236.1 MAG: 50S ribosomal protein L16 [Candidatus Carsonella ruddii]
MKQKPNQLKFLKYQKRRNKGISCKRNFLIFGNYGLKSIENGFLNFKQIESARKSLVHNFGKNNKILIRIFPDKVITKKPLEVRMGKGKGNIHDWISVIKPGIIIFEIQSLNYELVKKSFYCASQKLSIKTEICYE